MQTLIPLAEKIARPAQATRRDRRRLRIVDGGLISAAMLAVPGASAYFLGGAVVYTRQARSGLLGIANRDYGGHPLGERALRGAGRAHRARAPRRHLGPLRDRRHRPQRQQLRRPRRSQMHRRRRSDTSTHFILRTGSADRQANMRAFAEKALETFLEALEQ